MIKQQDYEGTVTATNLQAERGLVCAAPLPKLLLREAEAQVAGGASAGGHRPRKVFSGCDVDDGRDSRLSNTSCGCAGFGMRRRWSYARGPLTPMAAHHNAHGHATANTNKDDVGA